MARKQVTKKVATPSTRHATSRTRKASVRAAPREASRDETSHEDIARLAYALWESRGGQGGSPEQDWVQAERLLAAHLR